MVRTSKYKLYILHNFCIYTRSSCFKDPPQSNGTNIQRSLVYDSV
jgi:hypothetical protein